MEVAAADAGIRISSDLREAGGRERILNLLEPVVWIAAPEKFLPQRLALDCHRARL